MKIELLIASLGLAALGFGSLTVASEARPADIQDGTKYTITDFRTSGFHPECKINFE